MKKQLLITIILLSIGPVFASSMLLIKHKKKHRPTCPGITVECKGSNGNIAMMPVHVTTHYENGALICRPENEDLTAFANGDAQKFCDNYKTKDQKINNPCHAKTCKYIGWGYT